MPSNAILEQKKQAVAERALSDIGKEIESANDLIDEVKDRIDQYYEALDEPQDN